jgi:uncharacterized protein (TIGR00645 family)
MKRSFERMLESGIFASRWLLAPFYLGLIVCLGLLLLHFLVKLAGFFPAVPRAKESEVILGVLSLVDVAFTANLVLIVIFSGYENFVSKFDTETHDRPDWMTKVDFSDLKQKLMTSIVAISAIQVLKAFLNIDEYGGDRPSSPGWSASTSRLWSRCLCSRSPTASRRTSRPRSTSTRPSRRGSDRRP